LLDFESHMQRLARSMQEMQFVCPLGDVEILTMMRELVRRNQVDEGLVYMQITRGSAGDRDFLPSDTPTPTVFAFAQSKSAATRAEIRDGISMISQPDIRWGRRDIKTVGLMASVFAKMAIRGTGAGEALLHHDGIITEGAATSFYIIKDNTIITRPLSNDILHGCTRKAILRLVAQSGIGLDERACSLDEARGADEAFITGASTYVTPVVCIDGGDLGEGCPGPVTRRLQDIYMNFARNDAI
jgi:D-alanine transaminase